MTTHKRPAAVAVQPLLISAARKVAFDLLCRIELHGAFSDYVLNSHAVSQLAAVDRSLVTEIVYGTLRWQALLDYIAAKACVRQWERVDAKSRILLRMSAYQMWRMDRIPDHALVHDAVEIAKAHLPRGAAGFVNAVLRQLARTRPWQLEHFDDVCPPWIAVSLPQWLWWRWASRYGEPTAREYALCLNDAPLNAVRIIPSRDIPENLVPRLSASEVVPGAYVWKGSLCDLDTGVLRIQDEASQLVPHLLGEVKNWHIWDCCAAPGGKSAILKERSGSGLVISSDLHPRRAARMRRFLELFSVGGVVLVADARAEPPFRTMFDAVVVDAPCSGLGTLRRNPEIKWRLKTERLVSFRDSQVSILSSASRVVRPGGYLLYSTCSTEPEENEEVVARFLDSHRDFRLIRPEHPEGISQWLDNAGFLRTFPNKRSWDGFFAALMFHES